MSPSELPEDIESYVRDHREEIIEIIYHSSDPFARACAWVFLDRYSDGPELEELKAEIDRLHSKREIKA